MRRTFFLLLLLVSAASQAKDTETEGSAQQFIDRSVISFPNALANFSLSSQTYDPQQFTGGVSLIYKVQDSPPGTALSVFVYPLGRVEPTAALASGEEDIVGGVTEAQRQGIYSNLVIGDRRDFEVDAPEWNIIDSSQRKDVDTPKDKVTTRAAAANDSKDPDPIAEAAEKFKPPTHTAGRKVLLSFTSGAVARHSVGYVFYRNLYLIKIRLTLPADHGDLSDVETQGDEIARQLVPRIRIENYGRCGTIELPEPDPGKDKGTEFAVALLKEFARIKQESCANEKGEEKPVDASMSMQEIVFPAGTWK